MNKLITEQLQLLKSKLGKKFFLFHAISENPGTANRQVSIKGLFTLNKGIEETDFCKVIDKYSKILLYLGSEGIETAIVPGSDTISIEISERGGIDDFENEYDGLVSLLEKIGYGTSGSVHIADDFGSTMVRLYHNGKKETVLYHAYERSVDRNAC